MGPPPAGSKSKRSPQRHAGGVRGPAPAGRISEAVASPAVPGHLAVAQRALTRTLRELERWGPTGARVLLGLVFAWFGYHELVAPRLWTGYVPILQSTSIPATIAVLAHGWVLLLLAAALVLGVLPRTAAGIGALLMLEIVVALSLHGLNDIVIRDVGVLGLALVVSGQRRVRLALR